MGPLLFATIIVLGFCTTIILLLIKILIMDAGGEERDESDVKKHRRFGLTKKINTTGGIYFLSHGGATPDEVRCTASRTRYNPHTKLIEQCKRGEEFDYLDNFSLFMSNLLKPFGVMWIGFFRKATPVTIDKTGPKMFIPFTKTFSVEGDPLKDLALGGGAFKISFEELNWVSPLL